MASKRHVVKLLENPSEKDVNEVLEMFQHAGWAIEGIEMSESSLGTMKPSLHILIIFGREMV